jgi:hypothetical protein
MSSGELTRFNPLDVSDPEDQPAHIAEHATEAAPAHRGTTARAFSPPEALGTRATSTAGVVDAPIRLRGDVHGDDVLRSG